MENYEILKKLSIIKNKCESEHRDPNKDERNLANKYLSILEAREIINSDHSSDPPDKASLEGSQIYSRSSNKGYEKRSANESKSFNDLFGRGKNDLRWNDSNTSFFQAVCGGRYHPQLSQRSLNESTPSDGGFLVDSDSSQKIFDVALESSIIFPRAQIMPMASYQTKLAGFEIGSHATNLAGGFSASWTSEEGSITESQPKTRMMTLNAHKLAGFCKITNVSPKLSYHHQATMRSSVSMKCFFKALG